IGCEVDGLLVHRLFEFLRVAVVEDLYLDARSRQMTWFEILQRRFRHPYEDTGIPARLEMLPLKDEFEVSVLPLCAQYAGWATVAVQDAVAPNPSRWGTVHRNKVAFGKSLPSEIASIDKRLRQLR